MSAAPDPEPSDLTASIHSTHSAQSRSSTSSFFVYPVAYAVSGILRRLSSDPDPNGQKKPPNKSGHKTNGSGKKGENMNGVYTPPRRHASPFQPPPLAPLTLKGWKDSTTDSAKLLSRSLAEEIRLLIPPRLQLVDDWRLIYSLEQNGVSLSTLYQKCDEYRGKRGGYVLVVRDGGGGTFGAYLNEAPHPSPHFYGNGECFLWRAHILPAVPSLSSLPLPPSSDTVNAQRMTTIGGSRRTLGPPSSETASRSGTSTPERIRFKAFPYSGVNDYMIYCQHEYLSVGGGDGHYGLWLDDDLDEGVSSTCPTFGNEPLSDEGVKFDVLGVEIWYIGV